jgi:hypothetical protein
VRRFTPDRGAFAAAGVSYSAAFSFAWQAMAFAAVAFETLTVEDRQSAASATD